MRGETPEKPINNENLAAWQKSLERSDLKVAANLDLERGRKKGWEELERLDLPRYESLTVPLVEFLEDPDKHLRTIGSEKIYVRLFPKEPGSSRYVGSDMTLEEAAHFVEEHTSLIRGQETDYQVRIYPYFKPVYGGSIVINPEGKLRVEFKKGSQTAIAQGKIVPEFTVDREDFLGSFKYSFADSELRTLIHKTLMSIPHQGEGRNIEFTPGYYEFELIQEKEDQPLQPKFFDYQDNPAFYLPETT